jgi:hypothetical protein
VHLKRGEEEGVSQSLVRKGGSGVMLQKKGDGRGHSSEGE